jgi:hypothetical protein
LFKWGSVFKIGDGKLCKFWEDCWVCNVPLKLIYQDLYKLVRNPLCSVADCWQEGSWYVEFRRCLSVQSYNSWLSLLELLQDCTLTNNRADCVLWALDKKNQFTTKSLYRFLTDRGFTSRVAGHIWRSRVPLKIKFFLWQMTNNKLQVATNLKKEGGKGIQPAVFVAVVKLLIISSSDAI